MSEVVNQNRGCRVCGSTAGYTRVLNQLDQCQACGFITFNEVDPAALNALYDDQYFAGAEYADYVGQQDALRRSMRNHLEQMWRYHPGKGSLLEVGCAYGLFLDEARRFFTQVAGIDICASPIAYAKEKLRLNVECEDFQRADFGESRFDVICLWDTIEHLAEPEVYLSKAASLLNPGGMLFLTTGDIGSLNARLRRASWRQIHPPTHLHYFSRITLKRILNRFGFEVVGIETTPYYHTLYNILASIRMRRGLPGRLASLGLRLTGERLTRAIGAWINLGDIMFVAARANTGSVPVDLSDEKLQSGGEVNDARNRRPSDQPGPGATKTEGGSSVETRRDS